MGENLQAQRKMGKEKNKGIQCNVTADPSAFRHGHFHFTGETGSEETKEGNGHGEENVVELKQKCMSVRSF